MAEAEETGAKYAKVAVSDVTYWVDRPYDYRVPDSMTAAVQPGVRVTVPFSRGNRKAEGIVLAVSARSGYDAPKSILSVLDDAPVLTAAQLELALWMRERFFCTVYEAVKAILPAGLWFQSDGRRRASDQRTECVRLAVPPEDALALAERKARTAKQQSSVLRLLSAVGEGAVADVRAMTGAGRRSVTALVDAGLLELFYRERFRRPDYRRGAAASALPVLSEEQSAVFQGLSALQEQGETSGALLFGVTGSGKTAVYIHLIARTLQAGQTAILLVPEIALTPQMLEVFSSYFGEQIAVLHSSLSVAERYDEWKRVKNGSARLVIGTRSAIFAPVEQLGLVIVDEEQEDSYKSGNAPRYHAKDVAAYRCAKSRALLLLGSATPDISSRYFADTGRYAYFTMRTRYNRRSLPEVRIVDMKRELRAGNGSSISGFLREELETNLRRGEQSILFLNRRGSAKLAACVDCGYTFKCPNCSVNLTLHAAAGRLLCHACGYARTVAARCPDCGGTVRYTGDGTEKVEEQLAALFPDTPVLRVDTDTVAAAGGHDALFARFREEKLPIMIGTQMVTKGLNFENVTLVGVLSADQSLYAGSYRASERTFSLITQVIGRGGRAERPGRAVIQTFTPENQVIQCAAKQDYEAFYRSELELRRVQKCPPFTQIIALTAIGGDEYQVLRCCAEAKELLQHAIRDKMGADVLGPAPYPIVKLLGRFRYRLMLRCSPDREIRAALAKLLIYCNTNKAYRGVSVFAEMDPLE
ncbi:MAG: primosomal protein N' [Oscillospiraceae bacterium]|nr:primosomal protein N' [Oscillospiraceae bacterium]